MSNVLLINPSYRGSYGGAKASIVNPIFPTLALGTLAATAREKGHQVQILDLSWRIFNPEDIIESIKKFKPDIVGISATTPLMNQCRDISVICKDLSKNIFVVGGGSHVSSLPKEALAESLLDAVVVGEGDYTFAEICDGQDPQDILGLCYRDNNNEFQFTGDRPFIENLDDLPFPAWDLYDLALYAKHTSRLYAKKVPFVTAEFSRGCVYKCDFCASKMTMALGYRKKSPKRCAAEVKFLEKLGVKEFMLVDDIFTSDNKWAKEVSEEIINAKAEVIWTCTNGIRVESASDDMFRVLRKAGCYRVSFGFESGNDAVLKAFGKGGRASLAQGRAAIRLARKSGIDTNGYFMLGLSSDTEKTMLDTIHFAKSLPLDMLKFGITIAFPGTPMFNKYAREGLIKSYNWDHYHMYFGTDLFSHPNIQPGRIQQLMKVAYNKAIIRNIPFIIRRIRHGITTGGFFWDIYYFVKFLFMPETGKEIKNLYYAESRWPQYDYFRFPPEGRPTPVARNRSINKTNHSVGVNGKYIES